MSVHQIAAAAAAAFVYAVMGWTVAARVQEESADLHPAVLEELAHRLRLPDPTFRPRAFWFAVAATWPLAHLVPPMRRRLRRR